MFENSYNYGRHMIICANPEIWYERKDKKYIKQNQEYSQTKSVYFLKASKRIKCRMIVFLKCINYAREIAQLS